VAGSAVLFREQGTMAAARRVFGRLCSLGGFAAALKLLVAACSLATPALLRQAGE
jgi:hypothetical protein